MRDIESQDIVLCGVVAENTEARIQEQLCLVSLPTHLDADLKVIGTVSADFKLSAEADG